GHYVNADFGLDDATRSSFAALTAAFAVVGTCAVIWDVTGSADEDRRLTRSAASVSVMRTPVAFSFASDDSVLQTESRVLRLGNADGADVLIYPGLVVLRTNNDIALIDPRELVIQFEVTRFVETGFVPPDSEVVDRAWAKSNKDGSPDRRFA